MSTEVPLADVMESFDSRTVAADDHELTLLDILIALANRKRAILGFTATVAVVAIVVSLLLPKKYTATAVLLPPQQNSSSTLANALTSQVGSLGSIAALAGGGGGGFSLKNPNDQFVAMLKSRTVEDAMVQRFGLMKEYKAKYMVDARKSFERYSSVDGNGKDGLLHIEVEDRDPKRAAELANGYVEEFRRLSEHLAITEAAQRRLFFEQQLERSKDNLAQSEEALKATEQRTGVIQLDSQARALIGAAASLRAEITAKEVQIQSIRTFATDQNDQVVQAEQELASLRAQLSKLGGSESGNEADLIVTKGQVSEAGLEYVRKLRDVKYNETIFEILAKQFELAKLDEAKEGALIQVVDAAVPPEIRSFPKRSLIIICATLAAFIISLVWAMIRSAIERMKLHSNVNEKLALLSRALSFRQARRIIERRT